MYGKESANIATLSYNMNPVSVFPASLLRGKRTQKIIKKGSKITRYAHENSSSSACCEELQLTNNPSVSYSFDFSCWRSDFI